MLDTIAEFELVLDILTDCEFTSDICAIRRLILGGVADSHRLAFKPYMRNGSGIRILLIGFGRASR